MILTLEGAARFEPSLGNLSNVEILTYNTSNVEEMDLRQAVRQNLRSVGIDSISSTFGIPPHSHPLLQDAELHRKIQVNKHISAFLAATDHLPKLTLCASLIWHRHEQEYSRLDVTCHTECSNSVHACAYSS